MHRANFLKALAGLGIVAAVPKTKDEEDFAITSEDGRTAWDGEGSQVWSDDSPTWETVGAWRVNTNVITYDTPTHTLRQGDLVYWPSHDAKSWTRWTPKS